LKINKIGHKNQEKAAKMILCYLREKPDAGDTLEEIKKWWLVDF